VRPPKQGADAVYKDVIHLTRALGRAEADPERDIAGKRALCGHLRAALEILLKGYSERTPLPPPARKRNGGSKSATRAAS
jgi:hypothetical protein